MAPEGMGEVKILPLDCFSSSLLTIAAYYWSIPWERFDLSDFIAITLVAATVCRIEDEGVCTACELTLGRECIDQLL